MSAPIAARRFWTQGWRGMSAPESRCVGLRLIGGIEPQQMDSSKWAGQPCNFADFADSSRAPAGYRRDTVVGLRTGAISCTKQEWLVLEIAPRLGRLKRRMPLK